MENTYSGWTNLRGKKILIKTKKSHSSEEYDITEVFVLDTSDDGKYVKLKRLNDRKGSWFESSDINVLSVLTRRLIER